MKAGPGVRQRGGLGALPPNALGGAACRDRAQDPVFAPGSSEVAVAFLAFLYLVVHNLP